MPAAAHALVEALPVERRRTLRVVIALTTGRDEVEAPRGIERPVDGHHVVMDRNAVAVRACRHIGSERLSAEVPHEINNTRTSRELRIGKEGMEVAVQTRRLEVPVDGADRL